MLDVEGLEFWGSISFLKGGINFASRSRPSAARYARRFRRPSSASASRASCSAGRPTSSASSTASTRRAGIRRRDPVLPAPFSADDLRGKRDAKRAVLSRCRAAGRRRGARAAAHRHDLAHGRPEGLRPDRRGVARAAGARRRRSSSSAPASPATRRCGARSAARYPDRVGVTIGFDEGLAHLIEAGADMFLMPSRFEPCGLNQMYSLRYGTVPVVRATGGLDDTVDRLRCGGRRRAPASSSRTYTAEALLEARRPGAGGLRETRAAGRRLQAAGMRQDYSWDRSAREYVKLYEQRDMRGTLRELGTCFGMRRWQLFSLVGIEQLSLQADEEITMATDNVQTFTDRQLRADRAQGRTARAGRFLGGVVRPVPAPRADRSTRWRPTTTGKVTVGKLNVDENPNTAVAVQHPRHPDACCSSRAARSSSRSSACADKDRRFKQAASTSTSR